MAQKPGSADPAVKQFRRHKMPITQSRMISLINAALDYQQAFSRAKECIAREHSYATSGVISPEGALHNIESFVQEIGMLSHPVESPLIIASERRHFRANAAKNRASRKWQEKHRRELGLPPAKSIEETSNPYNEPFLPPDTAPQSITSPAPLLSGSIYDQVHNPPKAGSNTRTSHNLISADPDTLAEISGTFEPEPDPFKKPT